MINAVSFGVLTSVTLKITFWACDAVYFSESRRFADIRCLHVQGRGLLFQSLATEVYSEISAYFLPNYTASRSRKLVIFLNRKFVGSCT